MEIESIVIRYCEQCKKNTRQKVEFTSWCKVQTKCLEDVGGLLKCGYIHKFTLSHVGRYPFESMKPFTRIDLGIIVKENKNEV